MNYNPEDSARVDFKHKRTRKGARVSKRNPDQSPSVFVDEMSPRWRLRINQRRYDKPCK